MVETSQGKETKQTGGKRVLMESQDKKYVLVAGDQVAGRCPRRGCNKQTYRNSREKQVPEGPERQNAIVPRSCHAAFERDLCPCFTLIQYTTDVPWCSR